MMSGGKNIFHIITGGSRSVTPFSQPVESKGLLLLASQMKTKPVMRREGLRSTARQAAGEPVEEARQYSAVRV